MPLYVYQIIEADGTEGDVFEVLQRLSDPPLTVHPDNGKAVRKLISAPNAVTHYASGNLSNDKLSRLGFTKYQKAGDGFYEKKAGSGPDVIKG
ncbi:MAG: zinc ribbon domain-containing protein [Planctomycetes bacterium]|nr:zinc ribbon domain-containing protein [Planctomycetota bacterium]